MDDLNKIIEISQKCLELMPVIILGSGASIPHGIRGMEDLEKTHHNKYTSNNFTGKKLRGHISSPFLVKKKDLERALQSATLSLSLNDSVVRETRAMILEDDLKAFKNIFINGNPPVLSRLYRHLFNSTHRAIKIVTTNYDRLAEYAADCTGYDHYTGFSDGYYRSFNSTNSIRCKTGENRTIQVWKVHGSVDWFLDKDKLAIALPSHNSLADCFSPLLVTPGVGKYELTHQEPFRTIIANADRALMDAPSYLCVGYGFNDDHIQPKLIENVRRRSAPIVILSRSLTQAAKQFLNRHMGEKFLAIEESNDGDTKAYFHDKPNGITLPKQSIWKLEDFLDMTIGME